MYHPKEVLKRVMASLTMASLVAGLLYASGYAIAGPLDKGVEDRFGEMTSTPTARHSLAPWLGSFTLLAGAALADHTVDTWTVGRTQDTLNRQFAYTDTLPFVAWVGTVAVGWWPGVADSRLRRTARWASRSALWAGGQTLALKQLSGRYRPQESDSPNTFRPFDGQYEGLNGPAFPSGHTALAYAVVTPFAREYDLPLLYAAAGAVAVGRVTARDHWLSDVVAGGLLGYWTARMQEKGHYKERSTWYLLPGAVAWTRRF